MDGTRLNDPFGRGALSVSMRDRRAKVKLLLWAADALAAGEPVTQATRRYHRFRPGKSPYGRSDRALRRYCPIWRTNPAEVTTVAVSRCSERHR